MSGVSSFQEENVEKMNGGIEDNDKEEVKEDKEEEKEEKKIEGIAKNRLSGLHTRQRAGSSPPAPGSFMGQTPGFKARIDDLKLLPVRYEEETDEDIKSDREDEPQTPRSSSLAAAAAATAAPEDLPATFTQEGIEFYTDALGRRRILRGSVLSIVDYFLGDRSAELIDVQAFFLGYRLVVRPRALWDFIVSRLFQHVDSLDAHAEDERAVLVELILVWIERVAALDFFSQREKVAANPLWKGIHEVLKKLQTHQMTRYSREIMEKIKVKSREMPSSVQLTSDREYRGVIWGLTQTLFPRNLQPGQFVFEDLHPNEVAYSLTATDYNLFKRIRVKEFLAKTWIKDERNSLIHVVVTRFNYIAFWCATETLSRDSPSQRRVVLERLISCAQKCLELHNFQSCMQIVAGLSMTPVSRLKRTWALVGEASLAAFHELEELLQPMKNYHKYRAHVQDLRNRGKPYLPYIGLFLKDLIFADENPSFADEARAVVNFEKLELVAGILRQIEWVQDQPISVPEVPPIIDHFLQNLVVQGENELYQRSLEMEPREKKN